MRHRILTVFLTVFLIVCLIVVCLTVAPIQARGEDWPQFRGPFGDGRSEATQLPTTWGGILEPPVWETQVPGSGWSSPIVIGDGVWVTSAEQTAREAEANAKQLADHKYGAEEFQADAHVALLAIEVNLADGKIRRRLNLLEIDDPPPIHVVNSYASPTPVSDGERIYCHFGSLGTVCVEMRSGTPVWETRFQVDEITGPAASPVICGERLILVRDGCDQQYLVALDKMTGKVVWKRSRPAIDVADDKLRRGFSTPLVVNASGRTQIISPTAQWVVSYDPETGEELWRARLGDGHAVVPAPVYSEGLVFVCSGYPTPKLAAIRVDGRGDVTASHVAWTYDRQVPLIASPVVHGSEIYFVSNLGIATCLDTTSGKPLWQHRLSGNYAASPLAADQKLYFTSTEGVTTVVRPGREYAELACNHLFGETMSSLAVAGDSLLIRTSSSLARVRAND